MPKITEMWAYIMADADEDDEGIPAVIRGDLTMPMVEADFDRADSLKGYVQGLANIAGKPIRLVKFNNMEEMDVIHPEEGSTE